MIYSGFVSSSYRERSTRIVLTHSFSAFSLSGSGGMFAASLRMSFRTCVSRLWRASPRVRVDFIGSLGWFVMRDSMSSGPQRRKDLHRVANVILAYPFLRDAMTTAWCQRARNRKPRE